MKRLVVSLIMAVLPMCGAQKGAELPPITLYSQFAERPPAAVLDGMQAEVASIMAPMDLRFQWRDLSESNGRQVSVELAVIDFKGRCDVIGLAPRGSVAGPLGWTNITDGVILPFATVDCQAVRDFIQKELLDLRNESRERVFGRAIGRVLAHELYHIFANTTRHGSDGVGREFYSARDLVSPNFQFQARESVALMNGRAHANLSNAAASDSADMEHRN